jgi:hypothetical protein
MIYYQADSAGCPVCAGMLDSWVVQYKAGGVTSEGGGSNQSINQLPLCNVSSIRIPAMKPISPCESPVYSEYPDAVKYDGTSGLASSYIATATITLY